MGFGLRKKKPLNDVRFLTSYLGSKRKFGEKIGSVVSESKAKACYDFDGFGRFQLLSWNSVHNEKNIYLSHFIEMAYQHFKAGDLDSWWETNVTVWQVASKEDYFSVRQKFKISAKVTN